jgi:hypothetical protein
MQSELNQRAQRATARACSAQRGQLRRLTTEQDMLCPLRFCGPTGPSQQQARGRSGSEWLHLGRRIGADGRGLASRRVGCPVRGVVRGDDSERLGATRSTRSRHRHPSRYGGAGSRHRDGHANRLGAREGLGSRQRPAHAGPSHQHEARRALNVLWARGGVELGVVCGRASAPEARTARGQEGDAAGRGRRRCTAQRSRSQDRSCPRGRAW